MDYYILMNDGEHNQQDVVCYCTELSGFDARATLDGVRLDTWDHRITFEYDPVAGSRFTDYLANDLAWLIVSPKLKRVFKEHDNGIQYLPVRIQRKQSQDELDGYTVANVCNLVDALDPDYTLFGEYPLPGGGLCRLVREYALRRSKVEGTHVFRVVGSTFPVFVSERVKKAISQNRITGCDFLQVLTH